MRDVDIIGLLLTYQGSVLNVKLIYGIRKGKIKGGLMNKQGGVFAYIFWILIGIVIGSIIAMTLFKPLIC